MAALLGALLARERAVTADREPPGAIPLTSGCWRGQVSLLGYHLVGHAALREAAGADGKCAALYRALPGLRDRDVRDHRSGEQWTSSGSISAAPWRRRTSPPIRALRRTATGVRHRDQLLPEPGSLVQDAAGRRVVGAVGAGGRALWPDQYDGPRGSAPAGAGAWTGARAGPSHRPRCLPPRYPGAMAGRPTAALPRTRRRDRRHCSASTPRPCWLTSWGARRRRWLRGPGKALCS